VDEEHRRLIRIGLDALAEDYGYALAGGYAVQAHRIVDRLSDDVDLFAPIDRAAGEMPAAVSAAVAAYEAAGYTVEVAQHVCGALLARVLGQRAGGLWPPSRGNLTRGAAAVGIQALFP